MTTMRTLLRSIPRVHVNNALASAFRFVREEIFQLKETPIMELSSLIFVVPAPLTNVLEVLNNDSRSNRETLNYLFRNTMVLISAKTVLLLSNALKVSFRRPRSTRLKVSPQSMIPVGDSFYVPTSEELFIRGHGNTSDTSVYADKGLRGALDIGYNFLKDKGQEYFAFTVNQVRRLTFPVFKLIKVIIGLKLYSFLTTVDGEYRDFFPIKPYVVGVGI
jgi:hypothetical protein